MNVEQELDLLVKKVKDLENKISNRISTNRGSPKIRVCSVSASSTDQNGNLIYEGKELNVSGITESVIKEIYPLPGAPSIKDGDIIQVGQDDNSNNFFFPSGTGLILIKDKGIVGGKRVGKQVNKTPAGVVTEVDGSEQLELIAIDDNSSFHNSQASFATDRIYLGFIRESGGVNYYYVFLEGHGSEEKTFTVSITAAGTWTLTINTDNSGKVTSASAS